MAYVLHLPRNERAIQRGIDPRMPLPSRKPGREVIKRAYRREAQDGTVNACLEHFVTAVTQDCQHGVPTHGNEQRPCLRSLLISMGVCPRVIIRFYRMGSTSWTAAWAFSATHLAAG